MESLRDNLRRMKTTTPAAPINVFGILTEFVVLLLGALLFVIGLSGNYGIASRPTALVVLGVALIYWGVRSARKPTPKTNRTLIYVRSRSVIVLGVAVLAMSIFPREARHFVRAGGSDPDRQRYPRLDSFSSPRVIPPSRFVCACQYQGFPLLSSGRKALNLRGECCCGRTPVRKCPRNRNLQEA